MLAVEARRYEPAPLSTARASPRRVALTSVFGNPCEPRTWSGAPYNVASSLRKLGFETVGIHVPIGRMRKLLFAGHHMLAGYGRIESTESIIRGPAARRHRARAVADSARALAARDILHTGTLDLPPDPSDGQRHYLYCDQTWDLSLRHRPDAGSYSAAARRRFESLETESYRRMQHIFTFGEYVRDNIVERYGVPADRVTTVGSGMGQIAPQSGPKDYATPRLLFVAKHLFVAKGGLLVLDAFRIARSQRPDLSLTIVGDERHRALAGQQGGVEFRTYLPWEQLQQLYRDSTLLAQPMLNDPWGQVYLEALVSRTPVLGLRRNGLPEIVRGGRYGFLVDDPRADQLADAILDAVSDPARLAQMGAEGQRHVLDTYSWDRTASRIAEVIGRS